jgi:DNA modification methylase
VDAVVCDPPYGLSFMGKRWDYDVPSVEIWAECLRVLKPGGHLLAFAGTRTQHRMAVRIEDAGFEIRDMIAWVYGSGFPKSLDVSKALDKVNGEAGRLHKFTAFMRATGLTARQINEATGTFMGSHYLTEKSQPAIPTCVLWAKFRPLCGDVPGWVDELVARIEAEREVIGQDTKARSTSGASALPTMGGETVYQSWDITAPATPEAQQWAGWGTALKPALEPITMARKSLTGTVAANVLEHGTGALNVDGCRVSASEQLVRPSIRRSGNAVLGKGLGAGVQTEPPGRWPANLIHDGSDEVAGLFPQSSSIGGSGSASKCYTGDGRTVSGSCAATGGFGDTGSAARFFYTAKASKDDRDGGNTHPTVKPTDLMRYLCRLVTPPGGVVLDPFMGSGSTGKAAMLEGFGFIGIEREPSYHAIAKQRISRAQAAGHQPDLFAGVAA